MKGAVDYELSLGNWEGPLGIVSLKTDVVAGTDRSCSDMEWLAIRRWKTGAVTLRRYVGVPTKGGDADRA